MWVARVWDDCVHKEIQIVTIVFTKKYNRVSLSHRASENSGYFAMKSILESCKVENLFCDLVFVQRMPNLMIMKAILIDSKEGTYKVLT